MQERNVENEAQVLFTESSPPFYVPAPNTAHPPAWLYFSPLGLSLYNTVSALDLVFLIAFCVSHEMHSTRQRTWHCLIHGCVPNSILQTRLPY